MKENIKQSPATILQDFRCKQVSSSNPMFVHLDKCMVRISIYEFKCEENKDRAVLFVQDARGIAPYNYRTSILQSIEVKNKVITVVTRNSTYIFEDIAEGSLLEDFRAEYDEKIYREIIWEY